jgi:hypothetical protein
MAAPEVSIAAFFAYEPAFAGACKFSRQLVVPVRLSSGTFLGTGYWRRSSLCAFLIHCCLRADVVTRSAYPGLAGGKRAVLPGCSLLAHLCTVDPVFA